MKFSPPPVPTDSSLLLPRIRALLDDTERQIVGMRTAPDQAVTVIRQIDELLHLQAEARRLRLDARGEEARADALRLRALREAPQLVRLIDRANLRVELESFAFWQELSQAAQQRLQANLRRIIVSAGVIGTLIIVLFVVIPWLFPPTPTANTMGVIERIQSGNLPGALAYAQEEQRAAPNDADNLIWIGVLHERLGDAQAAEEAWATARRMLNNEQVFSFERSNARLIAGDDIGAEADARILIAAAEIRIQARGYMLLAGIEETRGNRNAALDAYNRAFDLASQANDSELQVLVRIRMGTLMQAPDPFPTPTP